MIYQMEWRNDSRWHFMLIFISSTVWVLIGRKNKLSNGKLTTMKEWKETSHALVYLNNLREARIVILNSYRGFYLVYAIYLEQLIYSTSWHVGIR